jgi:predicted enzyme related to lactoylglutathione lyase
MKNNPFVHVEIYVSDMARARTFYEGLFACEMQPVPSPVPEADMELCMFPMGEGSAGYGSGGMLVKMEGFAPGMGGTIVYFGCDDCGVEAARAAAIGGSIVQEKMAIGEHGFCALVRDCEGNVIGLHSMV